MVSLAAVKSSSIARVPRDFPGGTVLCVASGPSLTQADVDYCRDRVDAAVVVNNNYQRAPWAYALYAADVDWWRWHKEGLKDFSGLRYSVSTEALKYGVSILRNTGKKGLELSPDALKIGLDSGCSAINLAVHLGAKRVVLLGYDMQQGPKGELHWHPDHPHKHMLAFRECRDHYADFSKALAEHGIEVINCTRRTALTCFPCLSLEESLQ